MPWEILENKKITSTLSKMIIKKRLPHAILFTGEPGTGKSSLAIKLAQAVNCLKPNQDSSPCNNCLNCIKINNNTHPDLTIIKPEGKTKQIKIEDIRNLRSNITYKPYEAKLKVYIIKEAENLLQDTGNAFLKTLEEPPQNSLLILTCASENNLMSTILSRCLRFKIEPLKTKTILQKLNECYFEKSLVQKTEILELLSQISQGSLGLALSLEPEKTWLHWKTLDTMYNDDKIQIFDNFLSWVKEICTDTENNFLNIIAVIKFWWRNALILKANKKIQSKSWLNKITVSEIYAIFLNIEKLEDNLNRFIKPELAFEQFWLTTLNLNEITDY